MAIDASMPAAFRGLFEPHRYKVFYGGRGGGKSRAFARALLLTGVQRPVRVLCAREVQNSIRDSVKRLLDDEIGRLGLGFLDGFTDPIFSKQLRAYPAGRPLAVA